MEILNIFIFIFLFLTSCTYSITMVHTQGQADDVVDETQSTSTDVKPNVNIPLS